MKKKKTQTVLFIHNIQYVSIHKDRREKAYPVEVFFYFSSMKEQITNILQQHLKPAGVEEHERVSKLSF